MHTLEQNTRWIRLVTALVVLLGVGLLVVVLWPQHAKSETAADGYKVYEPQMVASALRSLKDCKVQMRTQDVPKDGVTKFAVIGSATRKGSTLTFAVVGDDPKFDGSRRPHWKPLVAGTDQQSADYAWSNLQFTTNSGSSFDGGSTEKRRRAYIHEKRSIANEIMAALTKEIGATASDVIVGRDSW